MVDCVTFNWFVVVCFVFVSFTCFCTIKSS